jgi:predicted small metal-binding protein
VKQFNCGDVVPGCNARFVFDSEEKILQAVAEHARKDHGLVHIPGELVAQVRERIRPAA